MSEIITKDNERIARFSRSLDRILDAIENLVRNHKPTLNGERYLTDREVADRLKVSRRTLQDYRNACRIPYCQLGGKILCRESDIQKILEEGYRGCVR